MKALFCTECGHEIFDGTEVAEGRWLCDGCAQHVRDTFALAAMLGISALDLLLAVSDG